MFLETCGKICFGRIRPALFFALALLPLFLAMTFLYFKAIEIDELEFHFQRSIDMGKSALQRKAVQEEFLRRYSQADPYFIDREVESLQFLEKEQKKLLSAIGHPAIAHPEPFQERLVFIQSDENKISFTEQNIRASKGVKETEEKQRYAVQVDAEDLKKLLSLIEDIPIDGYRSMNRSPQIIIQNFQLHKQITSIETEVFLLEMSLLKREFPP